jgi:chromosome segregation ATPase
MRSSVTIALAATLLAAVAVRGEEPKQPVKKPGQAKVLSARPATAPDSPLVAAAKAARKARGKNEGSETVITDATVKKSKGRLTVLTEMNPTGKAAPEQAEAELAKMTRDRAEAAKAAEKARVEVEALEKEITRLEKELASVEEDYYDESNVELREDVSQRDFGRTKAALAEARTKLEAARKRHRELAAAASNVIAAP